jgi:ABC-2 type transport system permease protein
VGRRAPLSAALLETAVADLAIVLVIAAGLAGSGLAAPDSLALAAGIGLTAWVFGAVAAVTAQVSEHARAASGWAMAALAAAAVVRGVGDLLEPQGSALSWFSPIAWAQQTRAFVDLRWWPLLLSLVVGAGLVALAYRLVAIRDVGSGLVSPSPGPSRAARSLGGVVGLGVRLQRASVIGWSIALVLTGAVFGSLADDVAGMVAGNPRLAAAVGAGGKNDLTNGFFVVAAQYLGVAVAAFAVASVLRVHAEEDAGRSEVVLATAVDRRRYLGGGLAVAVGASICLLLLAGLGTGIAAAASTGDGGLIVSEIGTQLVRLPAVLLLAALAVALLGLAPRLAALAWLPVTWAVVVASFGPLLGLPQWARNLSAFAWIPQVPDDPVAWAPLLGLTAGATVLVVAGLVGFRRRDVPA